MSKYYRLFLRIGAVILGGAFVSFVLLSKTESVPKALSIGYFYVLAVALLFAVVHKLVAAKLSPFSATQQVILRSLLYTIAISFAYLAGFVFQTVVLLPFDTVQEAVIDNLWKGFVYLVSSPFGAEASSNIISAELRTLSIPFFAMILLIGLVSIVGSFVEIRWRENKQKQAVEQAELNALRAEKERKLLEVDNLRKTQELEEARQLQLSLLPKSIPILPNLDIAVHMQTATEVGGDYYDFHLSVDQDLTIAIGDATGHGLRAGTMVTATKSIFNVLAGESDTLQVLEKFSNSFRQMNMGNLYMALTLAKLRNNRLTIAAAGMPPVMICRAATQAIEEIVLKAMPLGAHDGFPYQQKDIELANGDAILFMTDGFPELFDENKEMLDYARVKQYLNEVFDRSPAEIISHLTEMAEKWRGASPQNDDITFVVLKVRHPNGRQ